MTDRWTLARLERAVGPAAGGPALVRARLRAQKLVRDACTLGQRPEPARLAELLARAERLDACVQRVVSLAELRLSQRVDSTTLRRALSDAVRSAGRVREQLSLFERWWSGLPPAVASALMAHGALARYRAHLQRLREQACLEPSVERMLTDVEEAAAAPALRRRDELVANLRVRLAGQARPLSDAAARLRAPHGRVRQSAQRAIARRLGELAPTLLGSYEVVTGVRALEAQQRGHADVAAQRHQQNELSAAQVASFLALAEAHYPIAHRYYELKARRLGRSTMAGHDLLAPVAPARRYPARQARQLVVAAFARCAPAMARAAQHVFAHGLSDLRVDPRKHDGAFAHPTAAGAPPYLSLSYRSGLEDVVTLGHEAAHAAHFWCARKSGHYALRPTVLVAESVSLFAEQLVYGQLEQVQKGSARAAIRWARAEASISTLFRQVAITRFELELHAQRRAGCLDLDLLCASWLSEQRKVVGDAVRLDESAGFAWLAIPHLLHAPFYCYGYAIGSCFALCMLEQWQREPAGFGARFATLLERGNGQRLPQLFAQLGCPADGRSWQRGFSQLDELVSELRDMA